MGLFIFWRGLGILAPATPVFIGLSYAMVRATLHPGTSIEQIAVPMFAWGLALGGLVNACFGHYLNRKKLLLPPLTGKTYTWFTHSFLFINLKSCGILSILLSILFFYAEKPSADPVAELAPAYTNPLPVARHPAARLEISKPGVRTCSLSIDFSKWPRVAGWNRLACGIDRISYDARLEYLGHGTTGDRYRITLRPPRQETEPDDETAPAVYDAEVDFSGPPLPVFALDGVTFTLKS